MRLASIRSSLQATMYPGWFTQLWVQVLAHFYGHLLWLFYKCPKNKDKGISVLPTNNELELKIQYMVIIGAY